jgi:hypothetical protein
MYNWRLVPIVLIVFATFIIFSFSQNAILPQQTGPANVIIIGFSISSVVGVNAPLLLSVELKNGGSLASGNITLNVGMNGPSYSASTEYNVNPLAPFQNESLTILAFNKTLFPGEYTAIINASYISGGSLHHSASVSSNYSVVVIQNMSLANSTLVVQTQQLAVAYVPIYTALFVGHESVSEIGVTNTGASPEFVNISVDSNYTRFITLSTNSLYLQAGGTLYVQFVLTARNSSADIVSYKIPIRFNVTPVNGNSTTITENIEFTIANVSSGQPSLLNEVTSLNSTNSTTGIVEIRSGTYRNLTNATLVTWLPLNVAGKESDISTYGLKAEVSQVDGMYRILWYIPYLPAGSITYAYYHINQVSNKQFSSNIQNILTIPSILKPINILRIVNFSLPTLYVNSTSNISVDVLYTGTAPQSVYFYLTAPPDVTVYNSTQVANATPNQLLVKRFRVKTGNNPGTLIFTLYINTQGANTTYSLPVVLLERSIGAPGAPATSSIIIPPISGITFNPNELTTYIMVFVAILLIVLLIYGVMVLKNRPRYSRDRIKTMINVKEQIKR